ncbi:hypothetical protein ABTN20_19630, partial [Acinetobacter baumannii]
NTMRMQTRLGIDEIQGLLERMAEEGWVARVNVDNKVLRSRFWLRKNEIGAELWILLISPAGLRLADIYRLFVFSAASKSQLANLADQSIETG